MIFDNMRSIFLILVSFMVQTKLQAQSYIKIIEDGDGGRDFVQHSIAETNSGEFVVAGTVTPGHLSGSSDILVMKLDNSGNVLWSNYVDYGEDEFVGAVMVDAENNILLTGYKGQNGGTTPNKHLIIVKISIDGEVLADAVIEDIQPNYGYSLYGTDIESITNPCEENRMDYIIVGIGAEGAYASASKYGFVLKVNSDLTNISWGYSYQSTGTTNEHDSFNHILKVNHPWGGEVFLLTGTGKSNTPTSGIRMATNDLINGNGTSLWSTPKGNTDGHSTLNIGGMALYNAHKNSFFVLTKGMENDVQLLELDGPTGNNTGLNLNLHNHNHDHYIITGMEWQDSDQTKIILSGFQLEQYTNNGSPIFVEVDLNTFPQSQSVRWIAYWTNFDGNDLLAVPFDYIVQPSMPLFIPPSAFGYHNPFYTPKSSVISVDENRLKFVVALQNSTSSDFGLGLIDVDSNGEIEIECFELMRSTLDYFYLTEEHDNFIKSPHRFQIIEPGAQMEGTEVRSTILCQEEGYRPNNQSSNNTSDEFINDNVISLYPNPSNGLVHLESNTTIDSVTIYNLAGQQVNIRLMTNTLDFSNFPSGLYFVEIKMDGESKTFKIIKE